ncbi:hypothetical protein, partial [Pseudoalteromonas luteoviolacea]|uniref:hypothetical protein n=1 Tax=Pseudoalteromonas luteoviolacea TaxID=43657 RepID=UPI000B05097C
RILNALFLYFSVNGEPQLDQPAQVNNEYKRQFIYAAKLHWPYRNYTISLSSAPIPVSANVIYSTIFNAVLILAILLAMAFIVLVLSNFNWGRKG